jgi:hypothetical protein
MMLHTDALLHVDRGGLSVSPGIVTMTRLRSETSNQERRYPDTACNQQDVARNFVPDPGRFQLTS